MFATGRLRRRLESLIARFEPGAIGDRSLPLEEAISTLEGVVDAHFLEAERASATRDRLLRALDVIPQGVVLADDRGDVIFRNRSAAGFFAARHGEALVEAAIAELIAEAVDGSSRSRTLELYGPPRRSLLLRSVPLGEQSRPDGAFLVVEDVSDRQRLDAVRRDFVANISHELKTPVGALGLLAETIAMQDDPDVTRRLAERMQQEAFRVAGTIDDLLELSRIEADEHPPREPVRLELVVAEAVDRTRTAAELRQVEICVEPSASITVTGDRRQLVSATANLLDNAVKYSEPGSVVEIRGRTDGRSVEIEVVDHGVGIPARDLERVFERFYRVDRARSRETGGTGGTGLGLAIVRHVVGNHHGEVLVDSREGEGSTFTLRLPAGASSEAVGDVALDPVHGAG